MSLILIRTEQNCFDLKVPSLAPVYETYALAIDVQQEHPLRQRQKRNLIVSMLEKAEQDAPYFLSKIEGRDIPYDGGCLYLINFFSPSIEYKELALYQKNLTDFLQEFSPCLVEEDDLYKIERADNHQLSQVISDIGDKLFKIPREHAFIDKGVQQAKDQKESVALKKKI